MDSGIAFRSSREIKKEREEKRIAREKVLNQVRFIGSHLSFCSKLLKTLTKSRKFEMIVDRLYCIFTMFTIVYSVHVYIEVG